MSNSFYTQIKGEVCVDQHYVTAEEKDDNDRHNNRKGPATTPNDFTPTFYNPFEVKHRRRISREQFKKLEKAFSDNPKPNGKSRQKLADHVSMTPRGVQVWFQNRRAKAKQQKENKKKRQQQEAEKSREEVHVEPVLFSAYTMMHSRSQSSSSTTTYSLHNNSSMPEEQHTALSYPPPVSVIPSQTWNSDASTVTGVDEDVLKSPFTPLQTQIPSNIYPSPQTDFSWIDNANNMVFQNHNLTEQFFSTIKSNNEPQGDRLLDAWAYLDSLALNEDPHYLSEGKLVNSLMMNKSCCLGNHGLAYNRNVTDWIKTVSLAAQSCNMLDNFQTTSKGHHYSLITPEQNETYLSGQQIMSRLSEPYLAHHSSFQQFN